VPYGPWMQVIYVGGSAVRQADAAERLAHLADAGHRLVLVDDGESGVAIPDLPAVAERTPAVPVDAPRGSWFVTADPADCADHHRPGVRTMLIGPREVAIRPTRCDVTARDLRDAVLKILAADVMS
jgi:hypothetical protein